MKQGVAVITPIQGLYHGPRARIHNARKTAFAGLQRQFLTLEMKSPSSSDEFPTVVGGLIFWIFSNLLERLTGLQDSNPHQIAF
jgi:hypothetical protein